ncbi:hypothetical protein R3P38DRAFT_3306674 [Favolaschia claudopus]|uniref:Uncharacterized protein n=1 Tax=Favolaschia claudopus TaxID=2862362 RepID=A0AAW0DC91_9AGAR
MSFKQVQNQYYAKLHFGEASSVALAPIVGLCVTLAVWANLHVGLSRRNSGILLKALGLIVAGYDIESPTAGIPQDIRSAYKGMLEPEIIRTPCCPTCYKPYTMQNLPTLCDWEKSPRAVPCGTTLWKQVQLRNGTRKKVPKCFYPTQSFESWLQFFLSRKDIEDHLEKTLQRRSSTCPAWRSLGNFLLSRYHLVFGSYVDWFNPFMNKIAGPVVSYGVIVLYCLSLPIEVRFNLENIFIFGLIPGPGAPNVWTITNVLIAFANMMSSFALPGKVLPTYQNPAGTHVATPVVPLIADLQAIRKVAGYMAFNATQFCNWCLLTLNQIENLDYQSWTLRNSRTVSDQAKAWHDAIMITHKNELSKQSGVRWSPTVAARSNFLPFWEMPSN